MFIRFRGSQNLAAAVFALALSGTSVAASQTFVAEASPAFTAAVTAFNHIFTRTLPDGSAAGIQVGPIAPVPADCYLQFDTMQSQSENFATMDVTRHDDNQAHDRLMRLTMQQNRQGEIKFDLARENGSIIGSYDLLVVSQTEMYWYKTSTQAFKTPQTAGHWQIEPAKHSISLDDAGRTLYPVETRLYELDDAYVAHHFITQQDADGTWSLHESESGTEAIFNDAAITNLLANGDARPAREPVERIEDWRQW